MASWKIIHKALKAMSKISGWHKQTGKNVTASKGSLHLKPIKSHAAVSPPWKPPPPCHWFWGLMGRCVLTVWTSTVGVEVNSKESFTLGVTAKRQRSCQDRSQGRVRQKASEESAVPEPPGKLSRANARRGLHSRLRRNTHRHRHKKPDFPGDRPHVSTSSVTTVRWDHLMPRWSARGFVYNKVFSSKENEWDDNSDQGSSSQRKPANKIYIIIIQTEELAGII